MVNRSPPTSWRFLFVNCISAARLAGGAGFLVLVLNRNPLYVKLSLTVLITLLASDVLDGCLARRWNVATRMGYVLDGVADRSTHLAIVIALVATSSLSPIAAFLLILRDILLYASRAYFSSWWSGNPRFRMGAVGAATAFRTLTGGLLLLHYNETFHWTTLPAPSHASLARAISWALWAFIVVAYLLLIEQVDAYAAVSNDKERPHDD